MRHWMGMLGLAVGVGLLGNQPLQAQTADQAVMALPVVSLTFTASYVAEDFKLWEKEGLQLKIVNIAGVGALNSVIAGSSDFANTTAGAFTRAAANGQKMLALANTVERPMIEIVMRKEVASGIGMDAPLEKRAAALKGKTIAVDAINSITHGYLRIVARKAGLNPETDIVVTPMQPPNMVAGMKAKSIDGFTMSQPWTLQAVQDGSASLVASSPLGDLAELNPFAYNLIVARPETCAQKRTLCEKMGRGIKAATEMINDKPEEVLVALQKRFDKMDPAMLRAAFLLIKNATPRLPAVTEQGLANAEQYNVTAGLIPASERVSNLKELFTGDFVR